MAERFITTEIRHGETGAVLDSSQADADDPQAADLSLRGMLAHARLLSAVRPYEVAVARRGQTCEISRYCGGRRASPQPSLPSCLPASLP
jgi:hypothetical protein